MLRCTPASLRNVLVVESPNKVAALSKFLGKAPGKWSVVATVGHVNETDSFDPVGLVSVERLREDRARVIAQIITQYSIEDKGTVYLATDPDREGEVIAKDVEGHLLANNLPQSDIVRVSFNEITSTAVLEAVSKPGAINENLVSAGKARALIDFWFGYSASRLLWELGRRPDKSLLCPSAGRVQSPALSLVADRVAQRDSHKKVTYFTPRIAFGTQGLKPLTTTLKVKGMSRLSQEDAQQVEDIVKAAPKFKVKTTLSEVQKPPPAYLDTAACLKEASKQCKIKVQEAQVAMQKLFDEGFITYLRTDSTSISSEAAEAITKYVSSEYGSDYSCSSDHIVQNDQEQKKKKKTKKVKSPVATQEAHEAIRPTSIARVYPETGTNEAVYNFIRRRTLEASMPKPRYAQVRYTFTCEHKFKGKAITADFLDKEVLFKGSDVLTGTEGEPAVAAPVDLFYATNMREVNVESVPMEKNTTQPPQLLDQADLIDEMKKKGIGRPSTYNSVVTKIVQRGYAVDTKKGLELMIGGAAANTYMQDHFPAWVDYAYTATMEKSLDEIAQGKLDKVAFLKTYRAAFSEALHKAQPRHTAQGVFVGTEAVTGLNIWWRSRKAQKFYQLSEIGKVYRIYTDKMLPSAPTYEDFIERGSAVDTLTQTKEIRKGLSPKKNKKNAKAKASSA